MILRPVRKIKKLKGLPRDEMVRAREVVRRGGQIPKPELEAELARFERVIKYANYD